MLEYFSVSMIDYKLDKIVEFTTIGKLSTCQLNGKTVKCITNEYDIPFIISAPSVLVYRNNELIF